jgi:hypothetical protein
MKKLDMHRMMDKLIPLHMTPLFPLGLFTAMDSTSLYIDNYSQHSHTNLYHLNCGLMNPPCEVHILYRFYLLTRQRQGNRNETYRMGQTCRKASLEEENYRNHQEHREGGEQ